MSKKKKIEIESHNVLRIGAGLHSKPSWDTGWTCLTNFFLISSLKALCNNKNRCVILNF